METANINKFYDNCSRCAEKGSPEALGWENKENQFFRFSVLSEIGIKSGDSILDLGCGFGDILDYFKSKSIEINYKGIDVRPEAIKVAEQKYPNAEFKQQDIFSENKTYDWVLSSGVFSIQSVTWQEDTISTLKQAYSICKKGVSSNFLSSVTPSGRYRHMYYVSPSEFLSKIVENNFRRFVLRQDYKLNEFTVYLYRL